MVFVRQLGDGDVRQEQVQFDLVDGMAVDDFEGTLARFLLDDFREVLLQTDGVENCKGMEYWQNLNVGYIVFPIEFQIFAVH